MPSSSTPPPEHAGTRAQVLIGGILWYVDYESAVEVAKEQDKAMWVHFGENPG